MREEYLLKLSESDVQKAKELLSRPYIAENGPVRNEVMRNLTIIVVAIVIVVSSGSTNKIKYWAFLDYLTMIIHVYFLLQLELILKLGVKAEIQCLSSLGPSFLSEVYIPNKILSQAWI